MKHSGTRTRRWLVAVVLTHLVVSIVHGSAHDGAHVPLSFPATVFVWTVIVAGPLVGLALMWPTELLGSWLVALTMAGALVFGVMNHFVLISPDHVAHVERSWQPLFGTTAVLLAITEGIGAGLALRLARRRPIPGTEVML